MTCAVRGARRARSGLPPGCVLRLGRGRSGAPAGQDQDDQDGADGQDDAADRAGVRDGVGEGVVGRRDKGLGLLGAACRVAGDLLSDAQGTATPAPA